MIEYILDYIKQKGCSAESEQELKALRRGISLYLRKCGIPEDAAGEYYKKFVRDHLRMVSSEDLKSYFMNYPVINKVNQIAFEQNADGFISDERRKELEQLLQTLFNQGLGEKYIPVRELHEALGEAYEDYKKAIL